jgi:cytochrome c-type biogenesis protein CcmH/NrfG
LIEPAIENRKIFGKLLFLLIFTSVSEPLMKLPAHYLLLLTLIYAGSFFVPASAARIELLQTPGTQTQSGPDDKAAEDAYRRAMEADPDHMAGRFLLGRLLVKQGRLKEARELWNGRTSDEDNVHPRFIEQLTWAEDLKRATDALALNPNSVDALIDMGLAVMEGPGWVVDDRQKRAIVYFQKALKLKPDSARAQSGIVKAYVQIAYTSSQEKPTVDIELAKLRRMDPKLAAEMEEYREHYRSGGPSGPVGPAGPQH